MYSAVFSDEFSKKLAKIKKKDKPLFERLKKKIRAILQDPTHIKHLRNVLAGQQHTQLGPSVLRFSVEENMIYFITIEHYDDAY